MQSLQSKGFALSFDTRKSSTSVRNCNNVCKPQAALFTQLFSGAVERPRFRQQDMVQMGPLTVSPLGLGTWAWGNQLLWGYKEDMDVEIQKIFNKAVKSGINFFDTADSYGTGRLNGRSEILLGKFIADYPGSRKARDEVNIATKLAAYPWRLTPQQWVSAAKASLERSGLDKLSLIQLHWSTARYAPLQERLMWDGLVAIYDAGLCEAVGVSNFGPRQLRKIHTYLDKRGVPLASMQVQYSLLSKGPEQRAAKSEADALGMGLISYSPLALGLLTGKYSLDETKGTPVPGGPRGFLFKRILPGLHPLLDLMGIISRERNKTYSQIAVNWCMCQGTVPIPGAKTLSQLDDNLGSLGWRLSEGELNELSMVADKVPVKMQQNIFQTK